MGILPNPSNETLSLQLGLSSLGNVTNPWETVATDLFWRRHIG
jgi:hypothetical protein